MNNIRIYFTKFLGLVLGTVALTLIITSCEKTKSCPQGNICVEGNTLSFQPNPTGAKLILDAPPGSVYNNAAVVITDMVPLYPASVDYSNWERHFAGGMFKIEPFDLVLKKLVTLSIEYPSDGFIDRLGSNFEEDLLLYFIDDDGNWSIVNASDVIVEEDKVTAQVTRLGVYAVAAEKDCILGDWKYGPGFGVYDFNIRIVFKNQGTGQREYVVFCNESDTSLAVETFLWEYEDDKLSLFDFTRMQACDTLGHTSMPVKYDYECDGVSLTLDDDVFPIEFERYY